MSTSTETITSWGNGLELRLTPSLAHAAGFSEGTRVSVAASPGRLVIEVIDEPTLEQMLAAYDPQRHGGEAISGPAGGRRLLRREQTSAIRVRMWMTELAGGRRLRTPEQRIAAETAPARQHMEALRKVLEEKVAKEAAERKPAFQRAEAVQAFGMLARQRALRRRGFADAGPAWAKATPEPLRELIDRFNAHPKSDQEALLSYFAQDPDKADQLLHLHQQRQAGIQELGAHDRGMRRGGPTR